MTFNFTPKKRPHQSKGGNIIGAPAAHEFHTMWAAESLQQTEQKWRTKLYINVTDIPTGPMSSCCRQTASKIMAHIFKLLARNMIKCFLIHLSCVGAYCHGEGAIKLQRTY